MAQLKIFKLTVLPAVLEPSALYFIKTTADRFSIYLTDKDGIVVHRSPDSSDISNIVFALINSLLNQPGGIAGLDLDGNLIADIIATGIDGQEGSLLSNEDYVWNDLISVFVETASVTSGNRPSMGPLWGNLRGLLFARNTMQQVYVDFHIPHDYAMGTMLYPHVHWTPTNDDAGTVRWGFEYYIAKGHAQEQFPLAGSIFYVDTVFSTGNARRHYVAEPPTGQGIPAAGIEPDTVIKMRIFRDGANDTYNTSVHAWQSDIHYQVARIGTRNRAPNFFGV